MTDQVDKWVVLRESYVIHDIIGDTVPRELGNGQYVVRVTEENRKYLLGKKRYLKEELAAVTLETGEFLIEDESTDVKETFNKITTIYPDALTEVFTYSLDGVFIKTITIVYTDSTKKFFSQYEAT